MRQTAKIALAHYTCYPPLARARARAETGSEPPPESGNHRGACLRGRAGSWKLIRRLGLRPADGALSRPDVAEGALSGAAIAQGAEIALSGRDRADAAGDVGCAGPRYRGLWQATAGDIRDRVSWST